MSYKMTDGEKDFVEGLAKYFETLNQKSVTMGKVSKIIREKMIAGGCSEYLLQLPDWFSNSGMSVLKPIHVANIIRRWSPALEEWL